MLDLDAVKKRAEQSIDTWFNGEQVKQSVVEQHAHDAIALSAELAAARQVVDAAKERNLVFWGRKMVGMERLDAALAAYDAAVKGGKG